MPAYVSLRGDGGLCDFHDHYIFAVADGVVGIYKMRSNFTCAARKAYMSVNK